MPHPANRLNSIRLVRGQTKVLTVVVKTQAGAPVNLNGATAYFTARYLTSTGAVAISKVSPDGIEITDPVNGICVITLSSLDTTVAAGKYMYDMWVEIPTDPPDRHPVVRSAEMFVEEAITQFA